jgi:type IV pilus assembly protein PilV
MRRQVGFSLIEVLVSVVILSVGLLGTAGLIAASLKNSNTSYYRTQATVLADDYIDRMRANLAAAKAGSYDVDKGPKCGTTAGMAGFDCGEWTANLTTNLPGGDALGRVNASGVAAVTIEWDGGENSFTTNARL